MTDFIRGYPRTWIFSHPYSLLKQAGRLYTPSAFSLFQNEFDWSFAAYIVSCNEIDQMMKYLVASFYKVGSMKSLTMQKIKQFLAANLKQ